MPHVNSEAIDFVEYRRPARLAVTFTSGETYAYEGVPRLVYSAFLKAPSKGRFFALNVRDRYPTRRLTVGHEASRAA